MKECFFESRGIAYRTNGFRSDRPTLVFIHGLGGSASAWFPYESIFGETHNLLTFDLRGHGKSAKYTRPEDYALKNSADDLYALLTHLHIETCVLVSHSFGTLVALEFLHANPEKVSSVVLLSPTAFLRKTRWFLLVKIVGNLLVTLFRLLPFHPAIHERVDYAPFAQTGDWNVRRIFNDLRVTTPRIYLYCLAQAYAREYDALWGEFQLPTMIMHGKEDSIIPIKHAELLAKKIPGSTLVCLEHANHILVLNNIREVSEHLRALA